MSVNSIKRGDTEALNALLLDGKTAIDLTNADVVKFFMRKFGSSGGLPLVSGVCTIEGEPEDGRVSYLWSAGETDVAGRYSVEFEINWQNGTIQSVPNEDYETLIIQQDLG